MAGSTVSRTEHFALHRTALDAQDSRLQPLFAAREAWIGVLLPKRWAKRAVTRNAIKRQIYIVSQDVQPQLPTAAHVVRLRSAFDRKQFISATSAALKGAVRLELLRLFAGARA